MSDYTKTDKYVDAGTDAVVNTEVNANINTEVNKENNADIIDEPITLGNYQYHLSISNNDLSVKAVEYPSLCDYLCVVTPNAIANYRLVDSTQTLKDIIADRLIKKTFDSDFTVEYDLQKDRIIIKIVLRYMKIEEMLELSLEKISVIDDKIIIPDKMKYEYDKQVAKVSELEKMIISLKEELDTLKMETFGCRYLSRICVEKYIMIIDVREIDIVEINNNYIRIIAKNCPYGNLPSKNVDILNFLNNISLFAGQISMDGLDLFSYMSGLKKITKIGIYNCSNVIDLSQILNFPDLEEIHIGNSPNIQNLHIIPECKTLKVCNIDQKSGGIVFGFIPEIVYPAKQATKTTQAKTTQAKTTQAKSTPAKVSQAKVASKYITKK